MRDSVRRPGKRGRAGLLLLGAFAGLCSGQEASAAEIVMPSAQHARELDALFTRGDAEGVVKYAERIIRGTPTSMRNSSEVGWVYKYLGAGLHLLGELEHAGDAFAKAALAGGKSDPQAWFLLGDTLLHQQKADEAAAVFEEAVRRNITSDVSKLMRARTWVADWRDRDALEDSILASVARDMAEGKPPGVGAAEYTGLDPAVLLAISSAQPNCRAAVPGAGVGDQGAMLAALRREGGRERHRIGFITSDLGVHPVSSLVRGFLTQLDRSRFEVHVYCMSTAESWWRANISAGVEAFHMLHGLSNVAAAEVLRSHRLHTVVDLHGHTMHSGLPLLAYTPAAAQLTWLGSPMTTGARFVDWLVSDPLASPPTHAHHFSEKLLLLPPSYMANDHAQLLGHAVTRGRRSRRGQGAGAAGAANRRSSRGVGQGGGEGEGAHAFRFASFSGFQKLEPGAWAIWMNVLRRVPSASLSLMQYKLHEVAAPRLLQEAAARGVLPSRVVMAEQEPWIEHVWAKSEADLVLDTLAKSQHTTTLDALWAGVAVITLPGQRMERRAGVSAAAAMGMEHLLTVPSAKAYEDLAVELAGDPLRLAALRREVEGRRVAAQGLFDTAGWTRAAEAGFMAALEAKAGVGQAWHVWVGDRPASSVPVGQSIPLGSGAGEVDQGQGQGQGQAGEAAQAQAQAQAQGGPQGLVLLHIGGHVRREGWVVVDVEPGPAVDVVAPMDNLAFLGNSSAAAVYASHVLEHGSYGVWDPALARTLAEWHRVLANGGVAFISVPDLRTLAGMYADPGMGPAQRWRLMRVMFGGQTGPHDYHRVGLDSGTLGRLLEDAGFCEVRQVESIGLFDDSSETRVLDRRISLNLVATACKGHGEPRIDVSFARPGPEPEARG